MDDVHPSKRMTTAKTAAQRKADERQRHRDAGRTAVTVQVQPEYVPEVRALEAKLQRRERKRSGANLQPSPQCTIIPRDTIAGQTPPGHITKSPHHVGRKHSQNSAPGLASPGLIALEL